MKLKKIVIAASVVVAVMCVVFFAAPLFIKEPAAPGNSIPPHFACDNSCSLITEPDDGIAPLRAMIQGAAKSIDLVMYELEDKAIEADLAAAHKRGVAVRVVLSPGYEGEPSMVNEAAYDALRAQGLAVHWAPDHFALTHEKSLVIDGVQALIMSFNLVPKYYPTGRDFGVVDRDPRDVAAMEAAFNADWHGIGAAADAGRDLVWSPGSRAAIIAMIDHAEESLDIYNEEMADDGIIQALVRAAERGIAVRIDMTYSPDWKSAFKKLALVGVGIRTYGASAPLYIHAKMIIVDGALAFVGSENFSGTSLDKNRELGIMVSNADTVQSLQTTFNADWRGASPFSP